MCKILLHPQWGGAVYPATLFTDAPFTIVEEILKNLYPIVVRSTVAKCEIE
jgi:hypothetical protein